MTNNFRAEAEIELGGETRTMRLTYNAIAQIESGGASLYVLSKEIGDVTISVTSLTRVITAALNAYRAEVKLAPLSMETVGEWIMEVGLAKAVAPAHILIMRAFLSSKSREESSKKGNVNELTETKHPADSSTGTVT